MSILPNNFWSISCSGHNKVEVRNDHWRKTVCIRVQKLLPFSFNDFSCFHFLLLTSNDGRKPQSDRQNNCDVTAARWRKTYIQLLHDSVSSSQHLKNVSFRSYDLAHCRNHRKFQVFQLAKHKNNNLWTCCAQLNMRMISWALQLHYLKETNKR